MPQTRRGGRNQRAAVPTGTQAQSRKAPRKRAAPPATQGSKRSKSRTQARNSPSPNATSENDSPDVPEGGGEGLENPRPDDDWFNEEMGEVEEGLEDLTIENYRDFTRDWTLNRIRIELKRRRPFNRKITPQEAHDQGVLIIRESERQIAALALASRVSEHTLKKSM